VTWDSPKANGLPFEKLRWMDLDEDVYLFAVDFSVEMLFQIPLELDKDPTDFVRCALLESWLVNLRLMIEFLNLRGNQTSAKDMSAQDLGWTSTNKAQSYWTEHHETCSKWVVHLSKDRVIRSWETFQTMDTNSESLFVVAGLILKEYESFVQHLENLRNPKAAGFRLTIERLRELPAS